MLKPKLVPTFMPQPSAERWLCGSDKGYICLKQNIGCCFLLERVPRWRFRVVMKQKSVWVRFQNSEIDYSDLHVRDKSEQVVLIWKKAEKTQIKLSFAISALPKGSKRFLNMWCQWCVMKVWTVSVPAHIFSSYESLTRTFTVVFTGVNVLSCFSLLDCKAGFLYVMYKEPHSVSLKQWTAFVLQHASPVEISQLIKAAGLMVIMCFASLPEPLVALVCCGEREEMHCVSSACGLAQSQ